MILLLPPNQSLHLSIISFRLKRWHFHTLVYVSSAILLILSLKQPSDYVGKSNIKMSSIFDLNKVTTRFTIPILNVCCRDGAFLYSQPDNYSEVLTQIPHASQVKLLPPDDKDEFNVLSSLKDTLKVFDGRFDGYYFFKVKYEDKTGYVINQLLTHRNVD